MYAQKLQTSAETKKMHLIIQCSLYFVEFVYERNYIIILLRRPNFDFCCVRYLKLIYLHIMQTYYTARNRMRICR